jgi:hypothetical protein
LPIRTSQARRGSAGISRLVDRAHALVASAEDVWQGGRKASRQKPGNQEKSCCHETLPSIWTHPMRAGMSEVADRPASFAAPFA